MREKMSTVNPDELLARVRAEAERAGMSGYGGEEAPGNLSLSIQDVLGCNGEDDDHQSNPEADPLEFREEGYQMNDFLRYHDETFLLNAYRGILRRGPDQEGFQHFLSGLRSGLITKAEILGRLRYSREGRGRKVPVRGLLPNFLIQSCFKVPVLGYLLQVFMSIANFPTILRNFRAMENSAFAQLANQHRYMADLTQRFEDKTADLEDDIKRNITYLEQQIQTKVENRELIALHGMVAELEQRLAQPVASPEVKGMEKGATRAPTHQESDTRQPFMDALYALFEDRFRGTTDDIRARLGLYLPYLERTGTIKRDSPVLDLGCGRGEWLELLKDHGYPAVGVDLNRLFLAHCRERALDVVESDAAAYLKGRQGESCGAITGFHIVEHLSFDSLISLLKESFRVLKKGGIMILETPNPENLKVGSCDFYIDPTHRNPIPPATLHFLMEAKGFVRVQKVGGAGEDDMPGEGGNDLLVRSWLKKPRDYGMIGFKA